MKKIALLLLVVTLMLILSACKKNGGSLTPVVPHDSIPTTPTLTEAGIPTGNPVTKTIGKTGGSITSADGNAELIFPAGALGDNTSISIQAVTQTAPNGVGYGYKFLPEGIRFRQPVTLKFHYTADDLAATMGDLMGIAFQDSIGGWWRVSNFTNDTVNKMISAPIKHFTAYTPFGLLVISPGKGSVKVNGSLNLSVSVVESDDNLLVNLKGDGEMLAPLIRTKNRKITWAVNGVVHGNSTFGTIPDSNSLTVSFKAPAKVPKSNPVTVSASIDITFEYDGKTYTKGKGTLLSNIKIIEAAKFNLYMTVTESVGGLLIYTDHASMTVLVNPDGTVVISNVENFAPKSDPLSYTDGGCTLTWVEDAIGEMNVVGITGTATGPDPVLTLNFTHTGTLFPTFRTDCDDGSSETLPGFSILGFPSSLTFTLDKDTPSYEIDDGHIKATLTRIND
jgi:hypothetical protein